jgi:hypothetical protein
MSFHSIVLTPCQPKKWLQSSIARCFEVPLNLSGLSVSRDDLFAVAAARHPFDPSRARQSDRFRGNRL